MRKLFILIFLAPLFVTGQVIDSVVTNGHLKIKNIDFTFQKIEKGFYYAENGLIDSAQKEVIFVLLKNNQPILTHTLRQEEGDCNSITLELGSLSATDTSITFYSYYAWLGGCCGLPYGARQQTYKVNNNGALYLDKSEIYLERYKEKISEMDIEQKQKWISDTENNYNAKFVFGRNAIALVDKIKLRLSKQISFETKGWTKSSLAIKYGYRR